jgi:N-acetyl-gamma-glutamyl-phosphate reductase
MTFKVAVAGASGYVGGELLRLIAQHPDLEVATVTAGENAGQPLSSFQPHLAGYSNLVLKETSVESLAGHDVVFLALPHGKSAEIASKLPQDTLVVDCGADYRLQSASEWEKYYGGSHAGTWPYGMPELTLAQGGKLRGQLRSTKRIAVPGCNVSAVTLAIAPALTAGIISPVDLVATLSVGTSGAGRSSKTELSASEMAGNARAYSVAGSHRHIPEILQNVALASGEIGTISFTPVLVPISRGIIAIVNAVPTKNFSLEALTEIYQDAYGDEQFVRFMPSDKLPEVKSVVGSNAAQVWAGFDERANRVVFVCVLDNLVKGTAGAAIQSMNLALGLTEPTGLSADGVAP